jgi:CheY-like chemotaxis protein
MLTLIFLTPLSWYLELTQSSTEWQEQLSPEQIRENELQANPPLPRILLVDDNDVLRTTLKDVLEGNRFYVTTAANAAEALHLIDTKPFDVLLSDLHMPGPADGFTLVSAMRHTNPKAVTLVFTGFPALKENPCPSPNWSRRFARTCIKRKSECRLTPNALPPSLSATS